MSRPERGPCSQQNKDLLRLLTCGSVDDGKSTLIGRLLYECGSILDDQLDAVASAVTKPLFLGSVPEDMMDLDYLPARKVRVCLQGHHQFWAGV